MNTDPELRQFVERNNLTLQPDSYIPLYYQLYRLLNLFIKEKGMKKGTRFPSEEEITSCFNVSRPTVRRSIEELQRRGWLERHRGRGSYLKRSSDLRLGFLRTNLTFMDPSAGSVPHKSKIISRSIRRASDAVAAVLKIENQAPTVFIRRLFLVDGQPALVCDSHLSAKRFANLEHEPLINDSLYVTLRETYGCHIRRSDWSVQADEIIELAVADLLSIPLFSPVLIVRGIRHDPQDEPIEIYFLYVTQGMSVQDSVIHPAPGTDSANPTSVSNISLLHPPGHRRFPAL